MGMKTNSVVFSQIVAIVFAAISPSRSQPGAWCTVLANQTETEEPVRAFEFVGSEVNVCALASISCSCTIQVDDVQYTCLTFPLNGTSDAIYLYTIPILVEDQTVLFFFTCDKLGRSPIHVLISAQDVKILNVTMKKGCSGVKCEWMSPPTNLSQVQVICDGIQLLITNTSNSSIFLSVDDYFGYENCCVVLAAITPAGLGPKEENPFQLYSDPNNSVTIQDVEVHHKEDSVEIVATLTPVDSYCAATFPTSIATHVDAINYTNVENFPDVLSLQEGAVPVATLPKYLPETEITVIASNPAGHIRVTMSHNTSEIRFFFFENTNIPGEVTLGCVFVEDSRGSGCRIEVEGRENVTVIRNGLNGTTKYNVSEPGIYLVKVFDLDSKTIEPVLTDNFTVLKWPAKSVFEVPTETVFEQPTENWISIVAIVGAVVCVAVAGVCICCCCCCYLCCKQKMKNKDSHPVTSPKTESNLQVKSSSTKTTTTEPDLQVQLERPLLEKTPEKTRTEPRTQVVGAYNGDTPCGGGGDSYYKSEGGNPMAMPMREEGEAAMVTSKDLLPKSSSARDHQCVSVTDEDLLKKSKTLRARNIVWVNNPPPTQPTASNTDETKF